MCFLVFQSLPGLKRRAAVTAIKQAAIAARASIGKLKRAEIIGGINGGKFGLLTVSDMSEYFGLIR
jgi:hypothetical protein